MVRKTWLAVSLLVIASLTLTACQPQQVQQPVAKPIVQTVVVTAQPQVQTKEVVATAVPPKPAAKIKVLRMSSGATDVATIDPALAEDVPSIQKVEDTTVGLLRLNETNAQLEPGLATKWEVSSDGLVYTFHLRNDVPWVRYDGKQVSKVQTCPDKDGKTKDRMVTADDFAYGILRTLNPATASNYAYVLNVSIAGAEDYNSSKITDTAKVGVKAVDSQTLQVTVKEAAVYNLNILSLWVAHAQPKWVIEGDDCTTARGARWIETGFFEGYGPFTVKEWVHDSILTLVKNPFWPGSDSVPVAKIDEIQYRFLDSGPTFAEFEAGNMDYATIPSADMDRVMADPKYKPLIHYYYDQGTEFYSFNTKLKPTDDVRVRQALSMAIDRKNLVENVNKGSGEVAQWYCYPGANACPTMAKYPDLGVKYDPAKAKELMDAYLKEKGLTADKLDITLLFNTSASRQKMAEAIQQMWKQTLGINVKITNQETKTYYKQREQGLQNIFRSSWVEDYPDANNFEREVFVGDQAPYAKVVKWQNPKYNDLVLQAAKETDPAKRMDLYAQAEKILVVDDAVIAPLYWYRGPIVVSPKVKFLDSVTGYDHYEKWDITQ